MNDTDAQVVQARIAASLDRRRQLAPALAAYAQELPASRSQRQLRRLAKQLRTAAPAEEIFASTIRQPTWLPLLMAAGKPPAEGSQPPAEGLADDSREGPADSQGRAAEKGLPAVAGSQKHANIPPLAGQPTDFLQPLLAETARSQQILGQQTRVLAYPLVVLLLALGILVFLCLWVVPAFGEIFSDFGLQLPKMTLLLLELSDLLRFHAGSLLLTALTILALAYLAIRLFTARGVLGYWFGFLTAGSSRDVASVALFTSRLADLLDADLALPCALRLASAGCRRGALQRAAQRLARYQERPSTDHPGPAIRGLPATLTAALATRGPGKKPNPVLLRELAEMYAQWVHQRLDRSSGPAVPLAAWAAVLAVGFVVIALFVPLVGLIHGLTG